jgi:hypothetical protein
MGSRPLFVSYVFFEAIFLFVIGCGSNCLNASWSGSVDGIWLTRLVVPRNGPGLVAEIFSPVAAPR